MEINQKTIKILLKSIKVALIPDKEWSNMGGSGEGRRQSTSLVFGANSNAILVFCKCNTTWKDLRTFFCYQLSTFQGGKWLHFFLDDQHHFGVIQSYSILLPLKADAHMKLTNRKHHIKMLGWLVICIG